MHGSVIRVAGPEKHIGREGSGVRSSATKDMISAELLDISSAALRMWGKGHFDRQKRWVRGWYRLCKTEHQISMALATGKDTDFSGSKWSHQFMYPSRCIVPQVAWAPWLVQSASYQARRNVAAKFAKRQPLFSEKTRTQQSRGDAAFSTSPSGTLRHRVYLINGYTG